MAATIGGEGGFEGADAALERDARACPHEERDGDQPRRGERPAGQQMEGAEEFRDGDCGGTGKDRGTEQIVAQSPVYREWPSTA